MTKGTNKALWKNVNHYRTQMPQCHKTNLVRNGKKSNSLQNYLCKDCGRQFISDHEETYHGCLSTITKLVKIILVRRIGVRDISVILNISITKVLEVLTSGIYAISPKKKHYVCLEADEFWTYVGKKRNKLWLIMRITGNRGDSNVCVGKAGHENG